MTTQPEPSLIRMISIDPGTVHNGVSLWMGAKCFEVMEIKGDEIYPRMVTWLRNHAIDEVVCEAYVLYPWRSKEQSFDPMITVRRIGVIEYLCGLAEVPFIEQPASIKKPTFAVMKGRGIPSMGSNQHMRDSHAHGYYRLTHR